LSDFSPPFGFTPLRSSFFFFLLSPICSFLRKTHFPVVLHETVTASLLRICLPRRSYPSPLPPIYLSLSFACQSCLSFFFSSLWRSFLFFFPPKLLSPSMFFLWAFLSQMVWGPSARPAFILFLDSFLSPPDLLLVRISFFIKRPSR